MLRRFATLLLSLSVIYPLQAETVNVAGSTSVYNVMEILAEKYNQKNPEDYIAVQTADSTGGIILTTKGVTDIGMTSRYLTDSEAQQGLTIIPMAYDGIAMAVNIANPIKNLTSQQLADMYQGKITNWKQVGGDDRPIAIVTRESASGSRYSFESLLGLTKMLNNKLVSDLSSSLLIVNSNGMMKTLIANNPHAIGYISMGSIDKSIKAIQLNGVEPTTQNVANSKYALSRPFILVHRNSQLKPAAKKFLDYVLSAEAQNIIEQYGYIPLKK